MHHEGSDTTHESLPGSTIVAPAVESLLNLDRESSCWPTEVLDDADVIAQAQERRQFSASIEGIIAKVPKADMELSDALHAGLIDESSVAQWYAELADFLEHNEESNRVILYLPFEMLPMGEDDAKSETLRASGEKLTRVYMKRWKELLTTQDVRSNFVDGDVKDEILGTDEVLRVVKAAHLIPKLVERQMLSSRDVIALLERSHDDVLKNSIADALSVMVDMQLLSEQGLALLARSSDPFLVELSEVLAAQCDVVQEREHDVPFTHFESLAEQFYQELEQAREKEWDNITDARRTWLRFEEERHVMHTFSERIATAITEGALTAQEVITFADMADGEMRDALLYGVSSAIESAARKDIDSARKLFSEYEDKLIAMWSAKKHKSEDALASMFCRLGSLGVIERDRLERIGVVEPGLVGPFMKNIENMGPEMHEIEAMTAAIAENKELAAHVYPVSLFFGSRLKGYGMQSSDIDVAIFVKPECPIEQRAKIQELTNTVFTHDNLHGKIVEFWLEDAAAVLRVRETLDNDSTMGKRSWTHVLFGAAWCGDQATIKELHAKLLAPYLVRQDGNTTAHDERATWLEEMERDALQFRLMHRGYARFYPEQGGMHTSHRDAIDGDSTFWDSGYRRVATQLFVNRVFLPERSK